MCLWIDNSEESKKAEKVYKKYVKGNKRVIKTTKQENAMYSLPYLVTGEGIYCSNAEIEEYLESTKKREKEEEEFWNLSSQDIR